MRAFVRDVAIPAEARDAAEHGLDDALRAELQDAAQARRRVRAAAARGARRPRARHRAARRWCSRRPATACSARRRSTAPRPTRATCTCSTWSPTPEQRERYLVPLAAGDDPLVLRDDRARAGRRLRPVDAADARASASTAAGAINGRKWFITGAEGAAFAICMARIGADGGRARRCSSSTPTTPAGASSAPIDAIDRVLPRRARRGRLRGLPRRRRRRARRRRRGLPLRAGAARAGAADPLHALARLGAARARRRARPRATSARRSARSSASWGWCRS